MVLVLILTLLCEVSLQILYMLGGCHQIPHYLAHTESILQVLLSLSIGPGCSELLSDTVPPLPLNSGGPLWVSVLTTFLQRLGWTVEKGSNFNTGPYGEPPLKIKILKIGLRHVLSWPKSSLESKFHDSGTFFTFFCPS